MRLRAVSLLGCFYRWLRAVNGACSALNEPVGATQIGMGRSVVQESNNRFVLCGAREAWYGWSYFIASGKFRSGF